MTLTFAEAEGSRAGCNARHDPKTKPAGDSCRPPSPRTLDAEAELAELENALAIICARDGAFLLYAEGLFAFGYRPDLSGTFSSRENIHLFYSDLPAPGLDHPQCPYSRAGAAGSRTPGRRPHTPDRLYRAAHPEDLLADATPEEHADLEARLAALLDVKAARGEVREAFRYFQRLQHAGRPLVRLCRFGSPTPFERRRLEGIKDLQRMASRALNLAKAHAELADRDYRLVSGFPFPPDQRLVRARHRLGKRRRRWWEELPRGVAHRHKPARWKDGLSDAGMVYACTAAAYSFDGVVLAFSLRMDDKIEALARKEAHPADWMRRRIKLKIRQLIKCEVSILVVPEVENGKMHFHGVIGGVPAHARSDIRDALALAGGAWPKYRNRQVKLAVLPDSGWCSYQVKDFDLPEAWPRYSACRTLSAAARVYYGELRGFVIQHLDDHDLQRSAVPEGISAGRYAGPETHPAALAA